MCIYDTWWIISVCNMTWVCWNWTIKRSSHCHNVRLLGWFQEAGMNYDLYKSISHGPVIYNLSIICYKTIGDHSYGQQTFCIGLILGQCWLRNHLVTLGHYWHECTLYWPGSGWMQALVFSIYAAAKGHMKLLKIWSGNLLMINWLVVI